MKDLKYQVADKVGEVLPLISPDLNVESFEVHRVERLVYQLRIKESNGAARYINVKISEML